MGFCVPMLTAYRLNRTSRVVKRSISLFDQSCSSRARTVLEPSTLLSPDRSTIPRNHIPSIRRFIPALSPQSPSTYPRSPKNTLTELSNSHPLFSSHSPAMSEIALHATSKERRQFEDLADLYAIIKATEHLEKAYARDAVDADEYTKACMKLLSQFKSTESALTGVDVEAFIKTYSLEAPRAVDRLIRAGVPATTLHKQVRREVLFLLASYN